MEALLTFQNVALLGGLMYETHPHVSLGAGTISLVLGALVGMPD